MDDDTRDILLTLTREVSRLSTLVETAVTRDADKESRLRKLERWMYALPVSCLLALGSLFTSIKQSTGK